MEPNQPLPANYLDQIAPVKTKSSLLQGRGLLFTLLGAGLIILVIVASIAASAIGNSRKEPWQRLVARLDSTQAIVESTEGKIKSSQLRSLNSEVSLFVTNTKRDLQEPLTKLNLQDAKLPEKITTEESAQPALDRLEDARLNAVYDRTYAREMAYQLALVLSQLQKAYEVSSSESTKELLETTYNSLESTHESFSEYSASND